MKKWQHCQESFLPFKLVSLLQPQIDLLRIADKIAVGKHGSFGHTGCSTRILKQCDVFRWIDVYPIRRFI